MAVPAIPSAGQPWLTWAQGVDAEARKVADKLNTADIDGATAPLVTAPASATGVALKAALGTRTGTKPVGQKDLVYNIRDYGATAGTDSLSAIQACIADMPYGATMWVEPLPAGQSYLLSAPLVIDKPINVRGSVTRIKTGSAAGFHGSVFRPTSAAVQATMTGLVQITALFVDIDGLALVGYGSANGASGLLFSGGVPAGWTPADGLIGGDTSSHQSTAHRVMATGFDSGITFGGDSDHIYIDHCVSTGNRDGVRFGAANRFDFMLERCAIEGNTRSSIHVPPDANVVNVTVIRSHLGFSQYGIYQETPTTAGWGIAGLTLIDSPIETVTVQHIKLVNGGNINIRGGYWVWAPSPGANAAFEIGNVTSGPVFFNPRLEPNFPNASSPSVISITGFTNFGIYIDGALNGFAAKWINFGASVDLTRVFLQGLPFGGQGKGAKGVLVTTTAADQSIVSYAPVDHGLFSAKVFLQVTAATTVTLKFSYNDGAAAVDKLILSAVPLAIGNYDYSAFAYCYTYNSPNVKITSSVANAVRVSAVISPERAN